MTPSRRGAVLVAAMACLLIAMSLAVTALADVLLQRKQLRVERSARQAELLLTAGRDLAAARLASDASYAGDKSELTVPTAGEFARAEIEIALVDPAPSGGGYSAFSVTATFPVGGPRPIRRSQVFHLPTPSREE